jgi:hypothetical protein
VPAGFDHASILDNEDATGVDDRVQPMRDHNGGSSVIDARWRLYLPLGFGIERSSRLVEENEPGIRVSGQGAGFIDEAMSGDAAIG